jgi:pimeloyl-ACP methyl ester carboxylesterase
MRYLTLLCYLILALNSNTAFAEKWQFPDTSEIKIKKAGEFVIRDGTYDGHKADWGLILVPENRNDSDSKLICLPFIRHIAKKDAKYAPIFWLTGGPGKSNIWIGPSPELFTYNDLIKVGYRGVDSFVELKCPEIGKAFTEDNPLSSESIQKFRKILCASFDSLIQEGIDVNAYNMLEVVEDLEAVRRALGYDKINLFSLSYGTQVAYIYCLKYPTVINRNLMIGASNIERHFVWEPEMVDKQLKYYGELWKKDQEALAGTPDIIQTVKNVLKSLPQQWNDVVIDKDKVKISTFNLLYNVRTAVMVFDAYAAAEKGDYSGLAMLSLGYDRNIPHRHYWGEFFSKTVSSGLDTSRNYEAEMEPAGSIIGSPSSKLLWSAASHGGWPIEMIPSEYYKLDTISVETLILNGNLDFSAPPDYAYEILPYFKNGEIVILSEMGHLDVATLQREAFEHLAKRFYQEGVVDTSKYSYNKIDFTPEVTFQDQAKKLFNKEDIKK